MLFYLFVNEIALEHALINVVLLEIIYFLSMKRKLQFIFLLIINVSFAQDIAIPYRDGKKWGICNAESKLLIEPKFDKIEFYAFWGDYRVMLSSLKNLRGLIIDGKEILPPVYQSISRRGDLYIAVKFENGQKRTEVILSNGKSILAKPIVEIIVNEKFDSKFYFFHVLNLDLTESVFIYDSLSNTISQWLYEDFYSLDLLRIKDIKQVHFKVKKKQNDAVALETWNFSEFPKNISKLKTYFKSEEDLMLLFMKKNPRDYESGSGGGNGYGDYGVIKGDTGDMLTIDEPVGSGESKKTIVKEPVYMSNEFKIENNKLVLVSQNDRKNGPKKIIPVSLKVPIEDVELLNNTTFNRENDTINYFKNIVFYKKKNKAGILFSSKTKNLVKFDTIVKKGTWIYDDQQNNKVIFKVGNKDSKTNKFKYSFYSSDQKLLFPVQFDDLKQSSLVHDNSVKVLISTIGDKYGIVQNNGVEILKAEYDEIVEFQSMNSTLKIVQLKKDNKYRFITQHYSDKLNQNSALFDYPLKDVFSNYPKKDYEDSTGITQTINLLELVDQNKVLVGYANQNGTLYFKN